MNILMLSDVYFPRINGVSTSIRTFAQGLARMGHAVTLVAPDYGTGQQSSDDGNEGFEILRLPSRALRASIDLTGIEHGEQDRTST